MCVISTAGHKAKVDWTKIHEVQCIMSWLMLESNHSKQQKSGDIGAVARCLWYLHFVVVCIVPGFCLLIAMFVFLFEGMPLMYMSAPGNINQFLAFMFFTALLLVPGGV